MRTIPAQTGKSSVSAQLLLDDATGPRNHRDRHQEGPAIYLVGRSQEVPGIARLGPDPLSEEFTEEQFQGT